MAIPFTEAIRDLIGQLMTKGFTKGEVQNLLEALRYSPPVKLGPRLTIQRPPVSAAITGLHHPNERQDVVVSGDTSGQGISAFPMH